jgi:hypothetical protein
LDSGEKLGFEEWRDGETTRNNNNNIGYILLYNGREWWDAKANSQIHNRTEPTFHPQIISFIYSPLLCSSFANGKQSKPLKIFP